MGNNRSLLSAGIDRACAPINPTTTIWRARPRDEILKLERKNYLFIMEECIVELEVRAFPPLAAQPVFEKYFFD